MSNLLCSFTSPRSESEGIGVDGDVIMKMLVPRPFPSPFYRFFSPFNLPSIVAKGLGRSSVNCVPPLGLRLIPVPLAAAGLVGFSPSSARSNAAADSSSSHNVWASVVSVPASVATERPRR